MPDEEPREEGDAHGIDALEALHRRIEECAASNRWVDVEELMARRNNMLSEYTGGERRLALQAAKSSTDRVLALAKSARLELGGELAKLQEGRKASEAYRAHR